MDTIDKVKSRNELADFLDIPRKKLSYILYIKGVDDLYTSFEIPKKSGGFRHIYAPQKDLKAIQRKLAEALYNCQKEIWNKCNVNPNISHAFQKEKSFITNAKIHRNKRFVINIDLENFFDSFHFGRVQGYFLKNRNFQLPSEVATVIAQLTCYQGKLPQGAPTSPIITKEITEYQHQDSKPNRYYIKYSEESRDSLRLDKIPMMDALCTEEIKKYGKKEGTNRFINSLLNYYERNCDGMDTKTLETYASHSDGEIINIINQRINAEDMNGEPVFTEEEKRKLEKRRDEVLYDTLKMLKEEDLLENLNFPTAYLEPGQSPTYDDKLYEVDEGYLDYNNPNASRIEYYKKYIDRLNIEYYANITLEDDSMVTEISNHMYDLFDDDQYDITKIKKVFITKDEKREQETEEERKEGTLVFKYDEPLSEIKQRLQEQCKKEAKSK